MRLYYIVIRSSAVPRFPPDSSYYRVDLYIINEQSNEKSLNDFVEFVAADPALPHK